MALPTYAAREAINRGIGTVTRRADIYESDGATLWTGASGSDRLIDGGVNVSYGDNERRSLDLTLNNADNLLRSNPNGFWYDKVIKCYRGVDFPGLVIPPRAVVIERTGGLSDAVRFAAYLKRFSIDAIALGTVPPVAELLQYDMIFSYTGTTATVNASVLQELYNQGKQIVTISVANDGSHVPFLSTTPVTDDWGISQPSQATELSTGWTSEGVTGVVAGAGPTALTGGAVQVARWQLDNATYIITASAGFNQKGGRWFDLHLPSLVGVSSGSQIDILFSNGMSWLRQDSSRTMWETQVGEFVIDSINGSHFPSAVKVTGRDYVKKCLNSKIESAVTFDSGITIETLVSSLATNAGIVKKRLAAMPKKLTSNLSFDRGTSRWDIMRQAATTAGYELYFDAEGFLQTRLFQDPSTTSPLYTFETGASGNLSSLDRSTNDSRIYNHIVVYGDPPSGEQRLPYIGVAKNIEPTSPTRISKMGDRYYSFASSFFTSELQCQEYANRLLKLHALESYELSFSSINYPWIEVGEIAKVVDPRANTSDPTTYLLDSATIPLSLGPMSVTGKRVTIVG